jgi:anti-sigma-K factor RskA
MNVNEYISSGIIELYAMGALSPLEMKEVEQMAVTHAEIAMELERVQESLGEYAGAHARNPRPALRAEILQAIADSPRQQKGKIVSMDTSSSGSLMKLLVAACLVMLLISAFTIYTLYNRWKKAENDYAALVGEKNALAESYSLVKTSYDKTLADVAIMRNENSKMVTLQATDSTKNYLARVYWNRETHEAFIDVMSLPRPSSDQQYQLWALAGGKPIDAGVFDMDSISTMQHMKTILNADAWAVTLEPKGGSVSPTLSQMYLLSKS